MPEFADLIGPILDLVSWVCFVPGIPLLLCGWVVARRRCPWASTTAEVYEAGGFKGFRWSDGGNTPHLSLHTAEETRGLELGAKVVLHYDTCHPARWNLDGSRPENPVLAVGWALTGVGMVCTLAGFLLMLF